MARIKAVSTFGCFRRHKDRAAAWRMRLRVAVALTLAAAALGASSAAANSGAFDDVGDSVHKPAIDALAERGVFDGTHCGQDMFCPDEPVKRSTMAVWLVRAIDGENPAAVSASRFGDVDAGVWWAPHVERLADLGVTAGCSSEPALFCPENPVTRAQMASFLVRAFEIDPAPSAGFVDVVAGSAHAADIDALHAAGITAGCSSDEPKFCPDLRITRAQAAEFLNRALTLSDASDDTAQQTGTGQSGNELPVTGKTNNEQTGTGKSNNEFTVNGKSNNELTNDELTGNGKSNDELTNDELTNVELIDAGDRIETLEQSADTEEFWIWFAALTPAEWSGDDFVGFDSGRTDGGGGGQLNVASFTDGSNDYTVAALYYEHVSNERTDLIMQTGTELRPNLILSVHGTTYDIIEATWQADPGRYRWKDAERPAVRSGQVTVAALSATWPPPTRDESLPDREESLPPQEEAFSPQEPVWSATMTVGSYKTSDELEHNEGYDGIAPNTYGELSGTTFTYDDVQYTVEWIRWWVTDGVRELAVSTTPKLPRAFHQNLALTIEHSTHFQEKSGFGQILAYGLDAASVSEADATPTDRAQTVASWLRVLDPVLSDGEPELDDDGEEIRVSLVIASAGLTAEVGEVRELRAHPTMSRNAVRVHWEGVVKRSAGDPVPESFRVELVQDGLTTIAEGTTDYESADVYEMVLQIPSYADDEFYTVWITPVWGDQTDGNPRFTAVYVPKD